MEIIVLDVESTGYLRDPSARVIEIGAVKVNVLTGELGEEFSSLLKPETELTEEHFRIAKEVSGITKEDILSAPPSAEVLSAFFEFVKRYEIYTWNLPFDQQMMFRSFQDLGITNTKMVEKTRFAGCLMSMYTMMNFHFADRFEDSGNIRYYSLVRAMAKEGMSAPANRHRALPDAKQEALFVPLIFNQLIQQPIVIKKTEFVTKKID